MWQPSPDPLQQEMRNIFEQKCNETKRGPSLWNKLQKAIWSRTAWMKFKSQSSELEDQKCPILEDCIKKGCTSTLHDTVLCWSKIWSQQFAPNFKAYNQRMFYCCMIMHANIRLVRSLKQLINTAQAARILTIILLDRSKILYQVVDFLWKNKFRDQLKTFFLEGIRNLVVRWIRCMEKGRRLHRKMMYLFTFCFCVTTWKIKNEDHFWLPLV